MLVFLLNIISSVIERAGRGKNWTSLVFFAFIVLLHPLKRKEATNLISTISYTHGPTKSKIPRTAAWFSSHPPTVFSMLPFISLSFSYSLEINVSLFLSTGHIHFHRRLVIMVPCPLNWKGSRSTTYIVC